MADPDSSLWASFIFALPTYHFLYYHTDIIQRGVNQDKKARNHPGPFRMLDRQTALTIGVAICEIDASHVPEHHLD